MSRENLSVLYVVIMTDWIENINSKNAEMLDCLKWKQIRTQIDIICIAKQNI